MSNTLQLSPATFSIHLLQPRKIPNLSINGNGLDLRNLADDFEVHQQFIYSGTSRGFKKTPNARLQLRRAISIQVELKKVT
jgi:hypothetical protein